MSMLKWWRGALLPLLLLAGWAVLAAGAGPNSLIPTPIGLARAGWETLAEGTLARALLISLSRALTGLILGGLLGLAIGISIGMSSLASRLVTPTLHVVKLVSPFAWIPLIMAWLGLGEASKVAFVTLVAFLPVSFATIEAIASTPRTLIELGRAHQFTRRQFLTVIALPSAAPGILGGFHLAVVSAWMATLGAEYMLTSGGGIGAELVEARDNFATAELAVYVAAVGLVGVLLHRVHRHAEREILHWRRTIATHAF